MKNFKRENAFNLTEKEIEVLNLLVKGYSNKEISAEMKTSLSTTKVHVSKIIQKMKVKNRVEIVIKAIKEEII